MVTEIAGQIESVGDAMGRGRSLGTLGQVVVGLVVIGAIVVAAASSFALLWAVPFGVVGAVLAGRNPRLSIGWLLIGLGWAHALSVLEPAMAPWIPAPLIDLVARVSWPIVLVLYTVLGLVFPSGRVAGGRWGLGARILVLIEVACAVLNAIVPALGDVLIVPLLGGVAITVVSLVVRTVRADGLERRQLRWISGALALVVAAIVTGIVVSAVIPGSDEFAFRPVLLAFATFPIAIAIALLRERA